MSNWYPSRGGRPPSRDLRPSARKMREEATLDMLRKVRVDLWADLDHHLTANPHSVGSVELVRRIREIGEFLGAPTSWRDIPIPWLLWYEEIEHAPILRLFPEAPAYDEQHEYAPVDDEAIERYNRELYVLMPEEGDDEA